MTMDRISNRSCQRKELDVDKGSRSYSYGDSRTTCSTSPSPGRPIVVVCDVNKLMSLNVTKTNESMPTGSSNINLPFPLRFHVRDLKFPRNSAFTVISGHRAVPSWKGRWPILLFKWWHNFKWKKNQHIQQKYDADVL